MTVTAVPTAAELGETLLIVAVGNTVKANPLLGVPLTVTTTFPLVAPTGTFTVIEVALQLVTSSAAAGVPLKLTVLLFCDAPKFAPVIITGAVTAAELGEIFVILGAAVSTVNCGGVRLLLLAVPPAVVTVMKPSVALAGTVTTIEVELQLFTAAVVPLNFTLPPDCVAPKLVPEMVTVAPTGPCVGLKAVIVGDAAASGRVVSI